MWRFAPRARNSGFADGPPGPWMAGVSAAGQVPLRADREILARRDQKQDRLRHNLSRRSLAGPSLPFRSAHSRTQAQIHARFPFADHPASPTFSPGAGRPGPFRGRAHSRGAGVVVRIAPCGRAVRDLDARHGHEPLPAAYAQHRGRSDGQGGPAYPAPLQAVGPPIASGVRGPPAAVRGRAGG